MNCRNFTLSNTINHWSYTFFVNPNDDSEVLFHNTALQDSDKQKVSYIADDIRKTLLLLSDNLIENAKLQRNIEMENRVKNDRKCLEELFKKYPF